MRSFQYGACALLALASPALSSAALPVVDLGYERHRAFAFNESAQSFNFSNIPFAQPPLGDLRFRAPVPAWDGKKSSKVNNGSVGAICPQASPEWTLISGAFAQAYLTGKPFNETAYDNQINSSAVNALNYPVDPRTSEDCLLLDVVVPKDIFECEAKERGAPVLVWIYGGGYTEGEKTGGGVFNPYGLWNRSQAVLGEKFVYVALNYRLGAFGWLPGPTLQKDGTPNAALYDQRLALEWVQKYIHLFGGDEDRVTVMGESAGGGSIMHQITAFDGKKKAPFAQAIPQSPAWFPVPSKDVQEDVFHGFLKSANVSSIEEARKLTTEQLQMANINQVLHSSYGMFTFGPVVDGVFTPELPGKALLAGKFDHKLRLMIGHNGDEGLLFSAPNVTTNSAYNQILTRNFANSSRSFAGAVENTYYPPIFNGSEGYTDDEGRWIRTVSDSVFTCNTFYLAKGFDNKTFSYEFDVPPALHGQDVAYTFADDVYSEPAPNVAVALQEYITSFVATGNPNSGKSLAGVPYFPVYGANNSVTVLAKNITYAKDYLAGPRCNFWQTAPYA